MGSGSRSRAWAFWRRSFWARPGLLVVYAVVALACVPWALSMIGGAVQAGRALSADRICAAHGRHPCLDELTGTLHGPFHQRRSVNDRWSLSVDEHRVDEFDVGPDTSRQLQVWEDVDVDALAYDGEVMAVVTPDGRRYATLDEGWRGVVQWSCVLVWALAATVALPRHALRKRRAWGGWWRVDGPPVAWSSLPLAAAVAIPGVCLFLMLVGATWWVACLSTGVLTVAAVLLVGHRRRVEASRSPA